MIEEKKEEEEDLIEIRTVKEIVSRQFIKYLKMFKKRKLERMLMRKIWDHAIDLREGFVPKKRKDIPIIKNRKRRGCKRSVKEGIH